MEHEHNFEMAYTRILDKVTEAVYMCNIDKCREKKVGENPKRTDLRKDYSMPQQPFD